MELGRGDKRSGRGLCTAFARHARSLVIKPDELPVRGNSDMAAFAVVMLHH